jgi:hypothetical protein
VQYSTDRDIRERLGPVLIPIGRTAFGVCFGVVLSMTGIAMAWALFIFFGGQSANTWLGSLFFGAGLGAGIAGFVAWLRLDRENMAEIVLTGAIILGAGILGAWGGFEYGSTQEVECCAMPTKSPIYYTALGATAIANAAGVAVAVIRTFVTK